MDNGKELLNELEVIGQQFGNNTRNRTCEVLTEVARWVRTSGHGNITLSAVDHLLGNKIRAETIITAEK